MALASSFTVASNTVFTVPHRWAADGKPDPNDGVYIKDEDVVGCLPFCKIMALYCCAEQQSKACAPRCVPQRAVLDRNLYSTIICCQHAGRSMIAAGERRLSHCVAAKSIDTFCTFDASTTLKGLPSG